MIMQKKEILPAVSSLFSVPAHPVNLPNPDVAADADVPQTPATP